MNELIFLPLTKEIMKPKNELHKYLFDFEDNVKFKVFLAILSISTIIYRKNKVDYIQTFTIDGLLGKNSFLPRSGKLTFNTIEEIINSLESPFFDTISVNNKLVSFKLSYQYIREMRKNTGFNKIELKKLKSCRDIKATKLALIIENHKKGYLHLNYLLDVLKVPEKKQRKERIRQIKNAFKSINVDFEYKYPVNQNAEVLEEHYKFHY
ncbi:hypothetical protein [Marinomonas pollencensis]|uniref:Uncharacterized protein n=1 Tax=Marinomonas pollencensis TaxID=491954 RepID=A0A3E0DNR5_9GAMM|nr:hypothetical protein [Marinomonas pollencensis]REG84399.1 hypothetical protein DFP81_104283 [Marinomonas pollencensis]